VSLSAAQLKRGVRSSSKSTVVETGGRQCWDCMADPAGGWHGAGLMGRGSRVPVACQSVGEGRWCVESDWTPR